MAASLKKKVYFVFILLFFISADLLFAQDPHLSQPWSFSSTLNPAFYGGFDDDLKIGLGFSGQASDLGMVNHQYAYVDTKFGKSQDQNGRKIGLGASYYQYNNASSKIISPLNAGFYSIGGSYHTNISSYGIHSISLGTQVVYANGKANEQGAQNDPRINGGGFRWNTINAEAGKADMARYVDVNAGINYKYDNDRIVIESGLSAYHLFRPEKSVFNKDNIPAINRRIIFHSKANLFLTAKKRIEFSNILWLQGRADIFTSSFNQFGVLIKDSYRPINKFYIDYGIYTRSLKSLMPYFLASTGTGLDIRLSHEFPIGIDKSYSVKRTELSLCYTIPGKNSVRYISTKSISDTVEKKQRVKAQRKRLKHVDISGQTDKPVVVKPQDSDGDGVLDINDNCPDIKGSQDNSGCPINNSNLQDKRYQNPDAYYQSIAENGLQKADTIFYYVFFDKNSTTLYSKSFDLLNGVIYFMKDHAEYICVLSGHAYGEGDDEFNLSMSHHRVNSVKKYLLSYNIPDKNISTFEYGRKNPIILNNESLDWMNRRVEVRLIKKP